MVKKILRSIGLGTIFNQTVKLMNRATEDTVSTSGPIFVNAMTTIDFNNAMGDFIS